MKAYQPSNFKLLNSQPDSTNEIPHGNITYFISFLIPLVMFLSLYYVRDIFPFGNNMYLRSDMYHQYAPFFSEFYNKIVHGGNLTYSWDIGMGTNFTALYAYYLASPINWIIAIFPQKYLIEVMNVIIVLKLCGASLTFTYYISKKFNTKSCLISLFGTFYAMSAFVAAYSWNIMWLDCIILIPLIILGLENLVNHNRCFLYAASLGLCIFSNYYISIMVCITVVIYFIILLICYDGPKRPPLYLKKVMNWIIFSLLAGGFAAVLLLPEMYALSLSASSDISFPKTLNTYFPIMEMLVRQLINVPVHLGLDHYPNIYCGVAVFILIPLYIMHPKISTREKVGKVLLLLIFLIAFNMNIPNFVWHGLHFPNSLPCRQSFIYIFFLLAMSFQAIHDIKVYSKGQLTGALWFAIIFLVIAEQLYAGDKYNFKIMYVSGVFILLYMLYIYLGRNISVKKPILIFFLFTTAIIEAAVNMEVTGLSTTTRSYYVNDNQAVNDVMKYVTDHDPSFYRIEKISGMRTKNDAAWHNYKSISTFSSTANAGITNLLGYLGMEHSTNAYSSKGSTLLTDAIFNIKYLLANKITPESRLLKHYYNHDGEILYQNQFTLPIGFMVKSDINTTWRLNSMFNAIQTQNDFVELNTGIQDLFQQEYQYSSESDVTFQPSKDGHMYIVSRSKGLKSLAVSINGNVSNFTDLDNSNYTIDIGYVTSADNVEIYADSPMDLQVFSMNTEKFISAINSLKSEGLNVTYHSDTKIEGNVTASNDGIMMFSIPFDKGWKVTVDGKKVDTFAVKDALLGVNIPVGQHSVHLSYIPVGLIKGLLISLVSLIIFCLLLWFRSREKRGKISYTKYPSLFVALISVQDVVSIKETTDSEMAGLLAEHVKTIMQQDDVDEKE